MPETDRGVKSDAMRMVNSLPEDATGDDLMYRIYVRQCVDAGIADAEGSKIRVWFNRMHPSADQAAGLRLEVTDPTAPVLSGAVGLRTFQTAASFDNVIVLPLDALPSTRPQ